MLDPMSRPVIAYRWIVFGAAGFYSVYMITTSSYKGPGAPFRYLTIWALHISFFSASRMLAYSEMRMERHVDVLPSVAAVLNMMVVYLYWSLFFKDPALVNNGTPIWWREYYLHLAGPVLQWIDAFLVRRAFRRVLIAAGVLVVVVLAYVAWAELFVGPMNSKPVGTVTSGLPYPFLNNMEPMARAVYYSTVGGASLIVLAVFALLARGIRTVLPDRAIA